MGARAIGIVRVSQTAGREGESFASPGEQRDRIQHACDRDNLELVRVVEELDVSGGTPLERRDGLRQAVEDVEARRADVIVAAYFDRLIRSLRVQDELVTRVEAAGGRVLALDTGAISSGTAGQWLSGTLLGAVAEYQRRTSAERSRAAVERAVARGVVPFDRVPPGYRKGEDGRLVVEPDEANIVREVFAARASGATIAACREMLNAAGIQRSYRGAQALLSSKLVLGEIHFGDLVNLEAHEPIVDTVTWRRAQAVSTPRGPRPASARVLARLGILRCATCDSKMVTGRHRQNGRDYPFYRCASHDCAQRFTISAAMAESYVEEAVKAALADRSGKATVQQDAVAANIAAEKAQADLDAAIRAFAGLEGELAARERIGELRAARDDAEARAHHLRGQAAGLAISAAGGWDAATSDERRALITATVSRVVVGAGRGPERLTIELLGE